MRLSWTDDRIDGLRDQVGALDQRLQGLDRRVESLERRMDEGFREIREAMGAQQAETNARFDALQRTMIQFGGAMIAALVGLFAVLLGLVVTQL